MRRLALFLSSASTLSAILPDGFHPVVVTGPLLGQNLEIMNNDDSSSCNTGGEWKWLWGNPGIDFLKDALCLLRGLDLEGWDSKENLAVHKPRTHVRPRGGFDNFTSGFAAVESFFGMDILPGGKAGKSHLTPRLKAAGYVEGESYFVHGYDWRLGVHDWQVSSYPVLREIIQNAVNVNKQKVVMTGISMSGPYTHAFISWARSQDPTWPDNHIHAWVPVAAPWNGAVMAMSSLVSSALQTWTSEGTCPRCNPARPPVEIPSGDRSIMDKFSAWFQKVAMREIDEILMNILLKWPSMYFMSPGIDYSTNPPTDPAIITLANGEPPDECSADIKTASKCGADRTREGWRFDDPKYLESTQCAECYKMSTLRTCKAGYEEAYNGWVTSLCCKKHDCNAKTYRASELPGLMKKLSGQRAFDMMEYRLSVSTTADPGVPVHCVYSHNVQTYSKLSYSTGEDITKRKHADVIFDDGDATVDGNSAEVCTRWKSTKKVYRVPGVSHASALDVDQVLDVIVAVATNDEQAWNNWKEPTYEEVTAAGNSTIVKRSSLLIQSGQKRFFFV